MQACLNECIPQTGRADCKTTKMQKHAKTCIPNMQINDHRSRLQNPRMQTKRKKSALRTLFTFVCMRGFCNLLLRSFICTFGVHVFALFCMLVVLQFVRLVLADADAKPQTRKTRKSTRKEALAQNKNYKIECPILNEG